MDPDNHVPRRHSGELPRLLVRKQSHDHRGESSHAVTPQARRATETQAMRLPTSPQETPSLRTPRSGSGLLVWTHCEGTPDSPPPHGRLRPGQSHAKARPVPSDLLRQTRPHRGDLCAGAAGEGNVKAPGHHRPSLPHPCAVGRPEHRSPSANVLL